MAIISVTSHKGGVGKTTTVINLGAALREKGKRVMLIDLDGQCNLTTSFGINANDPSSIGRVLTGQMNLNQITKTVNGMDIVPAAYDLVTLEARIIEIDLLKQALEPYKNVYDYILLDCPPSLGIYTMNALVAADYYLVPTLAETYSYEALNKLNETVGKIRKVYNPSIQLAGVVFTMHSQRQKTMLGKQIEETVRKNLKTFATPIRNNIRLVECINFKQDVFLYDKDSDSKSNGASDYANLAEELLQIG
jgi:chromosome partitioning protein